MWQNMNYGLKSQIRVLRLHHDGKRQKGVYLDGDGEDGEDDDDEDGDEEEDDDEL